MLPYAWGAVLVLMVIAEALTTALVAIWFIPGAILALIFSLLSFPLGIQIVAFVVPSLGILIRVIFREKLFRNKIQPTNADALIGKMGTVTDPIDNIAGTGAVRVNGMEWSARAADGNPIAVSSVVRIERIEGVKLIVTPENTNTKE